MLHWVWPSPYPPPLLARPYTLTLFLSKPGSSPRLPFLSTVRWAMAFSKVPPSFGFQERSFSCSAVRPASFAHLLVVEERDGVPVLRSAVAVAVLAHPVGGEARLVVGVLDAQVVERFEDLQVGELAELLDVVGEHVRLRCPR